jgi:hypothetical protein
MANAYNPILLAGTQAQFDALAGTYVEGKLYFVTDTGKLYRANSSSAVTDFTDDIVVWPSESTSERPAAPIKGKIYINKKNGNVETYTGSVWEIISLPNVTTVGSASDDAHVPTAKAVWDAIEAAVGTDEIVKSIVQKTTGDPATPVIGTIEVTNADESTYDVALAGLATLPTYDATDRTFTFATTSGEQLVVTLGKDEFLDPTANNRYEDGYIYLYLNVPDPSVPGSHNTELKIDVSALIDIYSAGTTDSVAMTLDSHTNQFTADVVIRPDVAGTFTNALKLSTTAGAKGLYVDLGAIETDIYNLQNLVANSSDAVDMILDHDQELDNIHAAWGWGSFS